LTSLEYSHLQAKLLAENKYKNNSRRSIYKGGGAPLINKLRIKIKERNLKEALENLWKARKKLTQAKNKARKNLLERGIQARKDNKVRLLRLERYRERDELLLLEDLAPIREPDKAPIVEEELLITDKGHPGLVLLIIELEKLVPPEELVQEDKEGSNEEILISI
jgi:hypothetical protein